MTDTHTHLYSRQFEDGGHEAVRRALEAGVGRMIFPAVEPETTPALLALAKAWPGRVDVALGLHPTDLGDDWRSRLDDIERQFEASGLEPVAIGEVGIDLHWEPETLTAQKEAFARQLDMAAERGLPVIIHSRDALPETLDVIAEHARRHGGALPRLVFHSFTGGPDDVRAIREVCDPWFGINGVVTFRNAQPLRDAIPLIGLDRLLLETDSPYLAPVPHRGKRNESSCLPLIRDAVAQALGVGPREVEEATDAGAALVFPPGEAQPNPTS